MINGILFYWLLPTLITLVIFVVVLRHDGVTWDNFGSDDRWILTLFTVVWPIGVITLIVCFVDYIRDE